MIREITLGGVTTKYDDTKECTSFAYQGHWPHVCRRAVKVLRDGRGYCGLHDPVAMRARAEKREQRAANIARAHASMQARTVQGAE